MADEDVLLTPEEVAARFRVSPDQLAKWRHRGNGPVFVKLGKIGGSGEVRYRQADIEAYEAGQRVGPVS